MTIDNTARPRGRESGDPEVDGEPPSILSKAFDLLGAFTTEDRVLSLTELSRRTGWPKPTVHRLLHRLEKLGVVEAHGNGWRVGIRLLGMAAAMPVESMHKLAVPHLAQLHAWTKENVHFAALRGSEVVVLETLFSPSTRSTAGPVANRLPTFATALGRSMLAYLPDEDVDVILVGRLPKITPETVTDPVAIRRELATVRRTGVAFQRDQVNLGLGAIAAPVLIKHHPVGSVAVQFDTEHGYKSAIADAVKLTAQRIAKETVEVLDDGHADWYPFER